MTKSPWPAWRLLQGAFPGTAANGPGQEASIRRVARSEGGNRPDEGLHLPKHDAPILITTGGGRGTVYPAMHPGSKEAKVTHFP
jgi:hypothetical protein